MDGCIPAEVRQKFHHICRIIPNAFDITVQGTKMKMIHMLCCSLLLVTASFAQRSSPEAHALIGTWRVVEFADLDKDGKWQYWYGEHPRGYFVYDATGHVHIQIMKVPPLARFPEANWDIDKPPSSSHRGSIERLCR